MRRRDIVTLIAGAAAAWPFVARAQKPARIPHVVVISPAPLQDRYRELFRQIGYVEGRNIHLEFRDAGGYADRLPMLAEQLVQERDVDVIATVSLPAAIAGHKATDTIPVV